MSRIVSLNARLSHDADYSGEIEVVLVKITHPALPKPVRLSTDPTVRLSTEPLMYGTRSTWLTDDGSPFLFVLMGTAVPGDQEDAPQAGTLILQNVDHRMIDVLRSTTELATVDMAVVLASDPDLVEWSWEGLKLMSFEGDAARITLSITRDPLQAEPWPAGRMTKERFPGLHR